jgi:uncharacterized protein
MFPFSLNVGNFFIRILFCNFRYIFKKSNAMLTRSAIDVFLNDKTLAIAGVSRNPKKFGFMVYKTLREKGYDLYPVNPNSGESEETNWFRTVSDLPDHVNNLLIITKKEETEKVLNEAIKKGIRNVWIQQYSETPGSLKIASDNQINLVSKLCIMMYANPTGIHKFHGGISKFFGKYVG